MFNSRPRIRSRLNYKKIFIYLVVFVCLVFLLKSCTSEKPNNEPETTAPDSTEDQVLDPSTTEGMDQYKSVAVFYNASEYKNSKQKHYSSDGYYYGQKWQCVEFVKRFYYDAKKHPLPNTFGNAKDFYDPNLAHGQFNADRGLIQYKNGGNIPPRPDDILVFTHDPYGHVGIVTEVGDDYIEIIHQNSGQTSRRTYKLTVENNHYTVEGKILPTVWLRKI